MTNIARLDRGTAAAIAQSAPAHLEAEQALLGAVLVNNEAWNAASEFVGADDFADPLHGRLWTACGGLIERDRLADGTTLHAWASEVFEGHGGASYVARLMVAAVSVADAVHYARTIRETAQRRGVHNIGLSLLQLEQSDGRTAGQIIEETEAALFRLAEGGGSVAAVRAQGAVAQTVMDEVQARYADPARTSRAIVTGIAALDAVMTLERGDFLVLAGATSMGKSALADNIAEANERAGIGTAFFPLEVTEEQHTLRRLARATRIPPKAIRAGKISPQQFDQLMHAKAELEARPAWIGSTFSLTPASLRSQLRRLKRRHDIGLAVVDYIQLMHPDRAGREQNRTQDIGQITRALRLIAGELGIVIIGCSQLSRDVDKRDDHRPTLGDLRESGSLEQDATHVLLIFREEYYLSRSGARGRGGKDPTPQEQLDHLGKLDASRGVAELIIPKQRNDDAPVTVRCAWDGPRTRFSDLDLETPGGALQGEML